MLELSRAIAEKVQLSITPLIGKGREDAMDAIAEKTASKMLCESGVPMLVVSEESGVTLLGDEPEYICQLDPLDGTYNAAHGIPAYAFSIAFSRFREKATLEDIEYALVKNLVTGEGYEAAKGKKARLGSEALEPSKQGTVSNGTYCVYLYGTQLGELAPALKKFKKIRTLGCASLELCYVARGDYEGLTDLRGSLRNVDIAAGKLIVEEAGGRVTGKNGEKLNTGIDDIRTVSVIAAGNRYLHEELTKLLRIRK